MKRSRALQTSTLSALALLCWLSPERSARANVASVTCTEHARASATASPRSRKRVEQGGGKKASPRKRRGGGITVPIDVGIGPVGLLGASSVYQDQLVHTGMALSIGAVLDKQLIEANRDRVPAQYREQIKHVDSIFYRPFWLMLVPETLILSFPIWNTGMYGAIWRPIGLGIPLKMGSSKLTAGAALDLAYVYMHSTTLPQPTHFVRPGVNLHLTLLIPFTEFFLVSTGWSSDFFIPQPLGEPPWAFWPLENSLWHLGGPFLKLHFRIPYTVQL